MKIAITEMRDSMRGRTHIDDLIHKIGSPFTASITTHPLPPKFRMPTLDSYNGSQDPCDHVAIFKMTYIFMGFQTRTYSNLKI